MEKWFSWEFVFHLMPVTLKNKEIHSTHPICLKVLEYDRFISASWSSRLVCLLCSVVLNFKLYMYVFLCSKYLNEYTIIHNFYRNLEELFFLSLDYIRDAVYRNMSELWYYLLMLGFVLFLFSSKIQIKKVNKT